MSIRRIIAKSSINLYNKDILNYVNSGLSLYNGDGEVLREYQRDKLEGLLLYAYRHTEYYKEVFNDIALVHNNRVRWDRYNYIPILTKKVIRANYSKLISNNENNRHTYINTTGGSTGEFVSFIQDKEYYNKNFADKILFSLLNGKEIGDREIKLWGSRRDLANDTQGIKHKIVNFLYNRVILDSYFMNTDIMDKYINIINRKRPVQIWTYYNSIFELSKYIIKDNIKVFNPVNIICSAGTLYDDIKETIQRAFPQSSIINQYGARETGVIGCEIKNTQGIRIFDHSHYVEIFNKNNHTFINEGVGSVIVTNLNNRAMPLIRYDIGDIAKINKTITNMGAFSTLKAIKGRENSVIRKENGSIIYGGYFTVLLYHKVWVREFQVIQKSFTKIIYNIVLENKYTKIPLKEKQDLIFQVKKIMGHYCEVEINIVEDIPLLKSDKKVYVYSEI